MVLISERRVKWRIMKKNKKKEKTRMKKKK
jgi:hypothetical protein